MMLLSILAFIAVSLTVVMFATKQAMLGFACVIFWALVGAQAYTLATTDWTDIYFYVAFASLLGMTTFCAFGAFGLREKRDSFADEDIDGETTEKADGFIDEGNKTDDAFSVDSHSKLSKHTKDLRKRAERRRSGD